MSEAPRILLIEGDPYLAKKRVSQFKESRHPDGVTPLDWIEFDLPQEASKKKPFIQEELNNLSAEIEYESWDDDPRTILVRGLFNDPALLRFFLSVPDLIPEQTLLIVWDEHGTISASRSKKAESWYGFRTLCEKKGKALDFGGILSKQKGDSSSQDYAMREAQTRSLIMGRDAAAMLVTLVGKDRASISSEVERLKVSHPDEEVTKDMLKREVMPLSADFPVYLFYESLNGGSRESVREATEMLLTADKGKGRSWPEDAILILALRHMRKTLIAAHAVYVGINPKDALKRAFGAFIEEPEFPILGLPSYAFHIDPDKKWEQPKAIRDNEVMSISNFVQGHLTSTCPLGMDSRRWVFSRCLENYMSVYRGISLTRVAPPKEARSILHKIMDKISV